MWKKKKFLTMEEQVAKLSSKCRELTEEESRMLNGGGPSVWDSYDGSGCPYEYTTVPEETPSNDNMNSNESSNISYSQNNTEETEIPSDNENSIEDKTDSAGSNQTSVSEVIKKQKTPDYYKTAGNAAVKALSRRLMSVKLEGTTYEIDPPKKRYSSKSFSLAQRIENWKNGYGFRETEQIIEYNNSNEGKFARQGIEDLKKTEWSKTITGKKVLEGLEDAYNRGRIFIKKIDKMKGYQFFWGSAAYMYIDESTVNNYMNGNKKLALITLAHEGSHYTYATRNGILSGWWLEYEVEGYRINDILNLELNDKNSVGGNSIREIQEIYSFLDSRPEYRWIPSKSDFEYWNKEDIGQ